MIDCFIAPMLINSPKIVSILLAITFVVASGVACGTQTEPWEQKYGQLQKQREIIFSRLEGVYAVLEMRVREEEPSLVTRLSLHPPEPRETGYGLLPEIRENAAHKNVDPKETLYKLKWLEGRLTEELLKAEELEGLVRGKTDVETLVVRFEKTLKTLRNLENSLGYHVIWQKAVMRYPAYYRKKNELVALAREINALIKNNAPPAQLAELRQQLAERVSTFKSTSGLRVLIAEGGEIVLPVTVCTDIEDSDFLQAFQDGVQESFSRSPAARRSRFSVNLKWRFITANTLYPDAVPERGSKLDMTAHRALFPGCPLVLTTGASSLNALVGNRIFLGTHPVSRRTLAHEFGHLLGFEDAYVRGYDGEPDDPYGVVVVEWTGLTADLMGDSTGGRVSEEMITTLIAAYGGMEGE